MLFLNTFAFEKLCDMTCEQLIEKSADKSFTLSTLAGLRAHKKCENFKFDWRNITDVEKRIYSDELSEIDPSVAKPLTETTIEELRSKLKLEKNNSEKFKIYKQLRQKYKNVGKRSESKITGQQLYAWTQKNWKAAKKNPTCKMQYLEASLIQARILWNSDKIQPAKDLLKKVKKT